jgi:hypothetical protein
VFNLCFGFDGYTLIFSTLTAFHILVLFLQLPTRHEAIPA